MANNILTEEQCSQVDSIVDTLHNVPDHLNESIGTVEYVMAVGEIADWIEGTDAGRSAKEVVTHNMEMMKRLATEIQKMCDATDNYVARSRANNRWG